MKIKKTHNKSLSKEELLKLLIDNEQQEIKEMDKIIETLITKKITIDVNNEEEGARTKGEKAADLVANFAGSWTFIGIFILILILWIIINTYILIDPFDHYPFNLLNVFLSCIAALQAPIIMMSQNRQDKKDRIRSENDYKLDLKAELILEETYKRITIIIKQQEQLKNDLEQIKKRLS